jgi:beta-galactosidase
MFCRESIAGFMDEQSAILRKYSSAPITHNFAPAFSVNLERMTANLDFVSFDDYPSAASWDTVVFDNDLFRAAKPGRAHWFMETSVAHNGWLGSHEITHPPGFLAAEAVVSFGLGAEAINYWLWRQPRTGCELPHSAILSAWFKPAIGYAEVQRVETARKELEPLLVASRATVAEAAVTWSDLGRAMLQTEPLGARVGHDVDFNRTLARWHGLMLETGIHRDVRFEGSGCAISKASASLMTEAVKGQSIAVALELFDRMHALLTTPIDQAVDADSFGKLAVLSGVREFPMRVKCASLSWHTLKAAIANPAAVAKTE